MFKTFVNKWLNKKSSSLQNQAEAPKTFKQKNRSIFLNRYVGLVYFLVVWHSFGYVLMKSAKNKAEKEGIDLHQKLSEGTQLTKINIGKNFDIKVTKPGEANSN